MPTTLNGSADYTPAEVTAPSAVLPTAGDLAASATIRAAAQKVLDYISSLGQHAFDTKSFGVQKIRTVSSVALLKGSTDTPEGACVVLFDPTYSGGGSGLLSGVSLFVYSETATYPETVIPNVPGGYLVITPNDGIGRWINTIAGIGFTLGSLPTFVPRPANRIRLAHAENVTAGEASTATVTGDTVVPAAPFGIELGPITLSTGDECSVDASFTSSCSDSSSTSHSVVLEYKQGVGGTWQPIPGGIQTVAGPNNTVFAHTLSGVVTAAANVNHFFRVGLQGATGKTVKTSKAWSFRGLRLSSQ